MDTPSRKFPRLFALGTLVLIIVLTSIWAFRSEIDYLFHLESMTFKVPQVLNHTLLIQEQTVPLNMVGSLVVFHGWYFGAVAHNVTSASSASGHIAYIEHTPAGLFQVRLDGKVLVSDTAEKSGIALSPDSNYISFAELNSSAKAASSSSGWNIYLLATKKDSMVQIADGYAPSFTKDGNILYFTNNSLVARATSTPLQSSVALTATPSVQTAESPDHSLIAFTNSQTGFTIVFRVTSEFPLIVNPVLAAQLTGNVFGLTNQYLYSISYSGSSGTVTQYPLVLNAKPSIVGTIPDAMRIATMSFTK